MTNQNEYASQHLFNVEKEIQSGTQTPEQYRDTVWFMRELVKRYQISDEVVVVVKEPSPDDCSFPEKKVRAMFEIACFEVKRMWRLENQYWPTMYIADRLRDPWWLVETQYGLIEIGPRKSVYSIDWSDTKVRATVKEGIVMVPGITLDNVTKSETMVHAYSLPKIVEYLTDLYHLAVEANSGS